MVGAAYAAVPLYAAFCKATGYGGTTQVARVAPAVRGARTLSVSFDANVAPGLDWTFEPETPTISFAYWRNCDGLFPRPQSQRRTKPRRSRCST